MHPATLERSVDFALAPKATNTIVRRLGAFTAFVDYAVSDGQSPFPMSENSVFRYLDHMHTSNAAPSKASSFLQCLNWMRAVLQAIIPEDIHESSRVRGASVALQQKAPPPRRAPPLTVSEIREIESVACHAPSVQDRVIAGGVLFGIFPAQGLLI